MAGHDYQCRGQLCRANPVLLESTAATACKLYFKLKKVTGPYLLFVGRQFDDLGENKEKVFRLYHFLYTYNTSCLFLMVIQYTSPFIHYTTYTHDQSWMPCSIAHDSYLIILI